MKLAWLLAELGWVIAVGLFLYIYAAMDLFVDTLSGWREDKYETIPVWTILICRNCGKEFCVNVKEKDVLHLQALRCCMGCAGSHSDEHAGAMPDFRMWK